MPFFKSFSLCVTALLSGFTTVIGAPYPNFTATPYSNVTANTATNLGQWGPTIGFPLVPVAAALLPDTGELLVWSAFNDSSFYVGKLDITQTAIYDPATGSVTQYTVNDTGHDMFCPGGLQLAAGRGDLDKVKLFLAAGADVEEMRNVLDIREPGPYTALYEAVKGQHVETVRLLLEHGAKVDTPCSSSKETPLELARQLGNRQVLDLLE